MANALKIQTNVYLSMIVAIIKIPWPFSDVLMEPAELKKVIALNCIPFAQIIYPICALMDNVQRVTWIASKILMDALSLVLTNVNILENAKA